MEKRENSFFLRSVRLYLLYCRIPSAKAETSEFYTNKYIYYYSFILVAAAGSAAAATAPPIALSFGSFVRRWSSMWRRVISGIKSIFASYIIPFAIEYACTRDDIHQKSVEKNEKDKHHRLILYSVYIYIENERHWAIEHVADVYFYFNA